MFVRNIPNVAVHSSATFLNGPEYHRKAYASAGSTELVLEELGSGRFRLVVRGTKSREPLLDREIQVDGTTNLELDIEQD